MKLPIATLSLFCLASLGFTAPAQAASGYGAGPQFQQPADQNLGMQIYNQQAPGQAWQRPAQPTPGDQNLGMQVYNQQAQQLSDEQYNLATRLYNKSAEDVADARRELAARLGLLDQELAKAVPSKARIESLSAEIGALRGKILAAGAELRAKLAGNGLPPDCLGPCYSGDGYRHYGMMGPCWGNQYSPDGRRHHNGHGWNGWRGMMRNW